ncbi:hypothetical protein AMR72_12680 [Flavobacterium psychrophilum]|nr:hypothetical protein AMR72_12680 [Flavobacterium psychrophilum]AOE53299.1 hypothetical protein ALW18_12670 [Flavobacterium psychrophilum]
MNKLVAILFFLLPVLVIAQERQQLKGRAISDQLTVDFLIVKNTTSNASVEGNEEGGFVIETAIGDVLEFSAPIFKPLYYTVTVRDFKEELFVVRMETKALMLDEVQVSGLTGNLAIDSKNTKVILLNGLFDPAEINKNLVPANPMGNVDFVAIFGLIKNLISSSEPTKMYSKRDAPPPPRVEHKLFSKVLQESYPESFFTETIGVPREKLGLFLNFCNAEAKRYLLDPKNEADLIAYLKKKYAQYQNQSPNQVYED